MGVKAQRGSLVPQGIAMHQLEGLYVQFSEKLDPLANARIHALNDRLLHNLLPGISDLYPGYINLYVEFDAAVIERNRVRAWVRKHLHNLAPKPPGREVVVPVRYDGEDLGAVSQQTGFSVEEIIRRHSQREYQVYAVGFVPGQPMMGTLDPALYLPRRSTPRKRIEPNTVAMAVSQTCIYVLPTPGGWHLLGTTLESVYDPHREKPFLLEAGEMVRFKPSQGPTPEYAKHLETLPAEPQFPVLRVEEPGLLDLVLDGGRFMAARFGMARSGPMDERSASLANRVVGNQGTAPLLELTLKGSVLSVLRDTIIGFAGFGMTCFLDGATVPLGQSVAIKKGQRLSFKPSSSGVRAYLAVAGGFAVQPFMDSRSTDLQGLIGRALKAGDILGIAKPRTVLPGFSAHLVQLPATVQIRLQPGPQANKEALDALASAPFTVTSPNRMGVQLQGPKVPGGELVSEATPMGAVQITIDGNPIVLLNDRGRIGGYQKPAIVDPRDLPLVAQLRPGQKIRFVRPASSSAEHWFIQV
jgi:KipI family sensor histidine kinase inhibitor